MLTRLKDRVLVEPFDRAWRSPSRARHIYRQLGLIARFLWFSADTRGVTLYLALSGGDGQIFDLFYILLCGVFRRRVFVHHHSFAYVDSSTVINKVLFRLAKRQVHLVLSERMGKALIRRYGLIERNVIVVSNAAYFDRAPIREALIADREAAMPICLGFLSNVTFDKGFVEFFEVLARLRAQNILYRALVAGPVAPEARQEFERLSESASDTKYVGAVYGEAKEKLYESMDIFMFPTKYVNEADPLVIHEALRAAVYVLACDRGAIAETLSNGAGLALRQESFVDGAVDSIRTFSLDRTELIEAQRRAFDQAERLHTSGRMALDRVLRDITRPSGDDA
jgi:glycosyltransferase involved in cell wall biosynthesis